MKLLPVLFFLLAAPLLHAQRPGNPQQNPQQNQNNNQQNNNNQPATPAPTNILMWRCNLPGGSYSVALRSITSVSIHEYMVDAAVRVTEVNIDTSGNALARFYYLEPNTPNAPGGLGQATIEKTQEVLQQAADKTGQDAWKKVVKNYPTTTHSHTIEYRVTDKETLHKLYDSAESALRLNRNSVFEGK
jgi:hypothetical protein